MRAAFAVVFKHTNHLRKQKHAQATARSHFWLDTKQSVEETKKGHRRRQDLRKVAKKHSSCRLAANGGDLAPSPRQMVPEFDTRGFF